MALATEDNKISPAALTELVRALHTADGSIIYDYARLAVIRELLRVGAEHYTRELRAAKGRLVFKQTYETMARGRLLRDLKVTRSTRTSLEQRSAAAWDVVPLGIRKASRVIAGELFPVVVESGLKQAIGYLDRAVAQEAITQGGAGRARAAVLLRVSGTLIPQMLERGQLRRVRSRPLADEASL